MAELERMSEAQILAMRMMGKTPTRDNRVVWFLDGMLAHHGGALQMAHHALEKSTNTTVRRLAQQIIVAQHNKSRSMSPGHLPAQLWCLPKGVGRSCAVG